MSSTLLAGWSVSRISDIAFKGLQRKPTDTETFTYIDIGSIDREAKDISSPQILLGKDAPSRARKVINTGDILVSLTRPNLNAVAYVDAKYDNQIASTGFEVIKPLGVNGRFIYHLVRSKEFVDQISGVVQGALYPAAKSTDVQGFQFYLPPLPEQKAIAEKLDSLLAQVENTKARLERIPDILKQFRQSVLAAAVSGELISVFQVETVTIGEVCEVIGGLTKNAKRANFEKKIPYLRVANVYENKLLLDDVAEIGIQEKELKRVLLKKEDLLIVEGNGSLDQIGRAAIWNDEIDPCAHQNHLIKARPNTSRLKPNYLLYYLMSPQGRSEIIEKATSGAGLYTLSISKISAITINLPLVEEQKEIVRRVEELFSFTDKIEAQVNTALENVNHLTQSILAQAFSGKLTEDWRAQNPDLISGENSAEALLQRIKAERAKLKSAQKTPARTRKGS